METYYMSLSPQLPFTGSIWPLQISEIPPAVGVSSAPIHFSLVIPTYNGEKTSTTVRILSGRLDADMTGNYELVVDDNSPDRTWELAIALIPEYPQLRVMRRQDERDLPAQ